MFICIIDRLNKTILRTNIVVTEEELEEEEVVVMVNLIISLVFLYFVPIMFLFLIIKFNSLNKN